MLKLVHEHINKLWDETGFSLEKIRQNIIERHPTESISISKLHRILSEPSCKVSLDDLLMVVQDGFRRDPNVLLAKIGGQEYADSKEVGYKGTTELLADFAKREAGLHSHYGDLLKKEAVMRRNIHQAFTDSTERFDRATELFETHLSELKEENENLIKRNAKLETSRKAMFWGMLSALLSVVILFVIFILIDAPEIGAGW